MDSTSVSLRERLRQPNAHQAWARFVKLYGPLLYFWARRVGLQPQDAADLVQDVLTVLVQKMPAFCYDDQKSFRNWLRTVLHNKWRNHRRDVHRETFANGSPSYPLQRTPSCSRTRIPRAPGPAALRLMQADFQPTTWKAWGNRWSRLTAATWRPNWDQRRGSLRRQVPRARRLRQELAGLMD
jgi:RNA polymerase sigma-70 factor (ECF subfamily)